MSERQWNALVKPLVIKLEVAAAFGTASWDGKGAAAFAKLLQTMADKLDTAAATSGAIDTLVGE